jgi:cytochrome c
MSNRKIGLVVLAVASLYAGHAVAQEGNWRDGRKVFAKCKTCHSFAEGKTLFGPSLAGVFDRKAGTAPGYSYSGAMQAKNAAGLVWSDETMDAFLTKPKAFIPKTKMNFPGLSDAQDRANIIAYMKRRASR